MTNKLLCVLAILIIPFSLSAELSENKFSLKKVGTIRPNFLCASRLFVNSKNNFVTTNPYENNITELDINGRMVREVGGKGQGPGEFQSMYGFSYSNNNFYVCDYVNWRLSIFDDTLRFIDSFILRHNYENEIVEVDSTLYLFGSNYTDPWHQLKEYYLADVYAANTNGKYDYQKSIIKIWDFPKFPSKDFAGVPKYTTIKNDHTIYIIYTFLPDIIVYNTEKDTFSTIPIDFPAYIDPLSVNFKKYNKTADKKWGLKHFPVYIFSFYPEYFWYDALHERFIVQFGRPYQTVWDSGLENRYIIVIFDKDFNYLGEILTDQLLMLCRSEEKKIKMYMMDIPNFYDPGYIEPEEFIIEEYELE